MDSSKERGTERSQGGEIFWIESISFSVPTPFSIAETSVVLLVQAYEGKTIGVRSMFEV